VERHNITKMFHDQFAVNQSEPTCRNWVCLHRSEFTSEGFVIVRELSSGPDARLLACWSYGWFVALAASSRLFLSPSRSLAILSIQPSNKLAELNTSLANFSNKVSSEPRARRKLFTFTSKDGPTSPARNCDCALARFSRQGALLAS